VEKVDAVQDMQVMMLEGIMVSEQKELLHVTTYMNSEVFLHKMNNSDKENKLYTDNWAQECFTYIE
jgi:hypothetical protein